MSDGRPPSFCAFVSGAPDGGEVVDVGHVLDVPAVGLEALALVLGVEGERGRAVDRDAVVVVEEDELPEPEGARERGGLLGDALHQVPVGGDPVDAVVDDGVARAVVALAEELLRHRHADRVRDPLAERAGGGLDAGGEEVLRVPGCERLPLAEALDLLEGEVVPGQVQGGVLEDAGMPSREDEAVAVRPVGVRRVRPHDIPVEDVGHGSERHRGPRMACVGLLDRVHRERANRLDRQLLDRFRVLRHVTATIPTWLFLSRPA